MAEESPRDTNSIGQISYRKFIVADSYDYYRESALARLAARFETPARIEHITRTSSPLKEPKGWRDQFMQMISTRKERYTTHGQERGSNIKAASGSKVVPEELISPKKMSVPGLHLGNSWSRPGGHKVAPSINPVPSLKSLSIVKEHLSATYKQPDLVDTAIRSCRRAEERPKQKKLTNGGNISRLQLPGPIRSSAKLKRERMMTYPVFQLDPAVPSLSHFLAPQNEVNPTCRPSVLERLVLKGELLLSSQLRPDPVAENLGFQDPLIKVICAEEEDGRKPKRTMISFSFTITAAFNVPVTGLMFPPLERRVRVCLFDGCKFVGDVHVFPAVTAIKEEDEPWDFVNKGASRCLVQYSSTEILSLFVEVNVRYNSRAEGEQQEASEITCAWAMLDLPNNVIAVEELLSKTSSELPLLVGSMEFPVDVDTVHMPSDRSRMVVKKGGDSSAVHLHWYKLSGFQKKYSRLLPETILASNEDFPFLVLYRKTLIDTLLSEDNILSGDIEFSPLMQLYPWMLNESGKKLQELFKAFWIARKLEWPPNTDGDSSGRSVQIVQCMKNKNREKYLKGHNSALLMIWPVLRSYNAGQRPTWPFHSTFEDAKFEDPSDIIRKKVDVEIQKSPIQSTSSADDCASRSDPSGFSYDGGLLR